MSKDYLPARGACAGSDICRNLSLINDLPLNNVSPGDDAIMYRCSSKCRKTETLPTACATERFNKRGRPESVYNEFVELLWPLWGGLQRQGPSCVSVRTGSEETRGECRLMSKAAINSRTTSNLARFRRCWLHRILHTFRELSPASLVSSVIPAHARPALLCA